MTGHPLGDAVPVIDIGTALDLLAAAVEQRGGEFVYEPVRMDESRYLSCLYANRGAPDCIVGQALAFADICVPDLEEMGDDGVRDLYLRRELPVTLTLGALAVFDAAQRSQDRGCRWGDVLEEATDAAVKFLDLLPDTVFDAVRRARRTRADRDVACLPSDSCPAANRHRTDTRRPLGERPL